jgi:tetratricopeptide (TPR) repeat protein
VKDGYSPGGAPEIWEYITKENKANPDQGSVALFFASHPLPDERIKNLRKQARDMKFQKAPRIGEAEYLEAITPFRDKWFKDELIRGKFEQSKILLQDMQSSKLNPGEIHFFRGEIIRKEAGEDFILRAIEQYQKAINLDGSDPRPRKSIGLMLMKVQQNERAKENLEMYLKLKPDAEDSQIIQMYLAKLRS